MKVLAVPGVPLPFKLLLFYIQKGSGFTS